jgi:hypothetical protein
VGYLANLVAYCGQITQTVPYACTGIARMNMARTIDSAEVESRLVGAKYELVHGMGHAQCPGGGSNPGDGDITMELTF